MNTVSFKLLFVLCGAIKPNFTPSPPLLIKVTVGLNLIKRKDLLLCLISQ